MAGFCDDDEDCRFFDAQDSIAPGVDTDGDCPGRRDSISGVSDLLSTCCPYDVWIRSPASVRERRQRFLRRMGLSLDRLVRDFEDVEDADVCRGRIDRTVDSSGAVLRLTYSKDEFSSSQCSSLSTDAMDSSKEWGSDENFACRSGHGDLGTEFKGDDLAHRGSDTKLPAAGLNLLMTSEDNRRSSRVHSRYQQVLKNELEDDGNDSRIMNRIKTRWLNRLRSMTCIMSRESRINHVRSNGSNLLHGTKVQRVKVRHSRKRLKELSGLFIGQEIQAHRGSISTMKFSLDGQYLASGGEDKIVHVWQIVEDERSNETDIPDIDPSCVYFTVNHLSQMAPIMSEKEKNSKPRMASRTMDSACIVLPPKVFRILENPLHVFQGHTGEILDVAWSKSNCLLSSSIDKTVRLWKVGHYQCLKIFPHNNYVTCIQFNPVNDNYFISGSIDGKVRIWAVNGCQVVEWTDIRDIVTAVSYRPDGQGGIIGSMSGSCRFFNLSDNHIELEAQMCLAGKKKSPCKRITGFQFFPHDPGKVMITCADSQIRILSGINVISKYKGVRNGGHHISAFFTSDGKHIVSASEDLNVYIWNCIRQEELSQSQPKVIRSFECFSTDASIAIPWSGLKVANSEDGWQSNGRDENSTSILPFPSSTCFSFGQEFFLDSIPKGTATWPEDKLPSSSPGAVPSSMNKSHYKFLKSSLQSSLSSHVWGLVIVTAGWDGCIRSFHSYGLPVPV